MRSFCPLPALLLGFDLGLGGAGARGGEGGTGLFLGVGASCMWQYDGTMTEAAVRRGCMTTEGAGSSGSTE